MRPNPLHPDHPAHEQLERGQEHGRQHAHGDLATSRPPAAGRAVRVGIGGPVGSGKTALVAALCRTLSAELALAVVTNDIYTTQDADFLVRHGVLPAERVRAVEPVAARTRRSAMTSPPIWRRSRNSKNASRPST